MLSYTDSLYISQLSSRLEKFKKVGSNYNFRCPLCFDSAKNKAKKRGWLLTDKDHPIFYCHNCGASIGFSDFLKKIDHSLYNEYIYALMADKGHIKKEEISAPVPSKVLEVPEEQPLFKQAFLSICTPLDQLDPQHPASIYIDDRQIPKDKKHLLYYIENIQDIIKVDKKGKYKNRIIDKDSRIVIPIWSKNSLIGVSCRALDPLATRRYLIFRFEENKPLVFGLYDIDGKLLIDTKKKVFVVEGGIDSLFLENAIAVNGAELQRVMEMLKGLELVFSPDNEPRNKEIVKIYKNLIASNNSVVIYPPSIQEKDINEMVKLFGIYSVRHCINNSIYQGQLAQLKLSEWKKIN